MHKICPEKLFNTFKNMGLLLYLVSNHKEKILWWVNSSNGWDPLVLYQRVIGKDNRAGSCQYKLPTQTQHMIISSGPYHGQVKSHSYFNFNVVYLQQASSRGANMCNSLVLYGCDQQRCEEDVRHLPVEEVHSVVRLGHHGGMVSACGVVLHALVSRPQAAEDGKNEMMTEKVR